MVLPPPSSERWILLTYKTRIGIPKMPTGSFSMGLLMLSGLKTWIQCWTITWLCAWPTPRESSSGHNLECSLRSKIFQLLHQPLSVVVVWSIFPLTTCLGFSMWRAGLIKLTSNPTINKSLKDSLWNPWRKLSIRSVSFMSLSQILLFSVLPIFAIFFKAWNLKWSYK